MYASFDGTMVLTNIYILECFLYLFAFIKTCIFSILSHLYMVLEKYVTLCFTFDCLCHFP